MSPSAFNATFQVITFCSGWSNGTPGGICNSCTSALPVVQRRRQLSVVLLVDVRRTAAAEERPRLADEPSVRIGPGPHGSHGAAGHEDPAHLEQGRHEVHPVPRRRRHDGFGAGISQGDGLAPTRHGPCSGHRCRRARRASGRRVPPPPRFRRGRPAAGSGLRFLRPDRRRSGPDSAGPTPPLGPVARGGNARTCEAAPPKLAARLAFCSGVSGTNSGSGMAPTIRRTGSAGALPAQAARSGTPRPGA